MLKIRINKFGPCARDKTLPSIDDGFSNLLTIWSVTAKLHLIVLNMQRNFMSKDQESVSRTWIVGSESGEDVENPLVIAALIE